MNTTKYTLIFALFFLLTGDTFAAHIVGGGVTYECLGPSGNGIRYRFTMKVYRNCAGGGGDFDNPAHIAVYEGNYQSNSYFDDFTVPLASNVKVNINQPDCIGNLPFVCLEEGTYTWERVLPISNESYFIVYQRCCRTNNITNILAPDATGATYYTEITPTAQLVCNNSPVFNHFPPAIICNHYPMEVDYSADDPEGDQLVYSFCAPVAGGGNVQGGPGANGCNGPLPNPPCAPPFDEVIFTTPNYSAGQPMGGNPVISIDPQTGVISGTPQINGQFVVGVCVEEYRNGILLSVTRRDFQFKVTDCAPQVKALVEHDALPSPQHYIIRKCSGTKTVTITNQSLPFDNIKHFEWTFDLNNGNTIQDTSNFDLTVDFPDFGVYNGILVLNNGLACGDTAFIQVELYPPATLDLGPDFTICQDTNVLLNAGSDFASFAWQNGSTAQTFNAVTTGTYFVAAKDQCNNVYRDSVFITLGSAPPIQLDDATVCPGGIVIYNVPGFDQYAWNPSPAISCTSCAMVTITPIVSDSYTVSATTQAGCTATKTVHVEVLPTPTQTYVIQFYPNQSVTLGGQTYTQPATVTIPVASTTGGCDSLNTYILELLPTTLDLECPANLTVALQGNAGSIAVNYAQPTTTTDCPGSDPIILLTQGLSSGAHFSAGLNTVCYSASNTCGDQAACCFTIMVSTLSIQCPPGKTYQLPIGANTIVVNYPDANTTTNCPDPSVTLSLQAGSLPSGSDFFIGESTVCFQAVNTCGNVNSCCFSVKVLPSEPACDVKTIGCMKFELLDIRLDSIHQPRFRIRTTNYCSSEVDYILNELPPGIVAVTPTEGSIYTAANTGNTYKVRNPNASPFNSIRYRSISPGIKNGEADVFEHRLPQQSFPNNYIHVYARLKDGQSFEAYLNTFNCPVQPWTGGKNLEGFDNRGQEGNMIESTQANPAISFHPNPTTGLVMVDIHHWQGQRVQLRLFNAQGQEVLSQAISCGEEWFELNLQDRLANGLYYLVLQPAGGKNATAKFVLER